MFEIAQIDLKHGREVIKEKRKLHKSLVTYILPDGFETWTLLADS